MGCLARLGSKLHPGHSIGAITKMTAPRPFFGNGRLYSGTSRLCKADEDEIFESVGKVQHEAEKGQQIPRYPANGDAQVEQENEDEIFASVGKLMFMFS